MLTEKQKSIVNEHYAKHLLSTDDKPNVITYQMFMKMAKTIVRNHSEISDELFEFCMINSFVGIQKAVIEHDSEVENYVTYSSNVLKESLKRFFA